MASARGAPPAERALRRFVLLYALAWVGGVIGYTPLLTLLLPMQVDKLVGRALGLDWLAWMALAGAAAASLGGILFGWLSDVTRNRRGWIVGGLVLSSLLLVMVGRIDSFGWLIAAIIAWQLSINMMLGPLSALAADFIPDRSKGMLGGLQAFAPGFGALAGVAVTQPGLDFGQARLAAIALMVIVCVLPLMCVTPPLSVHKAQFGPMGTAEPLRDRQRRAGRMWLARLCVQLAEATLFAYLFFWLSGLDPKVSDQQIARLFSYVLFLSAPLALAAGRWSDRHDRPIAPLRLSAAISALGLLLMAITRDVQTAMMAYGVFGVSSSVFLALHSAQTLRILPRPEYRGRDLGLFNLANTVPSLIMPWLAMTLLPAHGFAALFLLLAALATCAALLLAPRTVAAQD